MNARRLLAATLSALSLLSGGPARAGAPGSPTRFVDPFIGTEGTGHTFPGASTPFAMVAPGPDNADTGWDFASGYQYRAPRILGFSNTHISGAGIGEFGDVLLQPVAGAGLTANTRDFSAAYRKASEQAHPGYYSVELPEHGVRVELTSTQRVAFHRYTFATPGKAQVLVDLQHVIRFLDGPRVVDSRVAVQTRRGEISGVLEVKNWVDRRTAFVLRFDHPITKIETLPAGPGEKAPRYLATFDLADGRVLLARAALSTVDVAGARRNLRAAAPKSFDAVRAAADRQWADLLGRVDIEAPDVQKRIFYTSLYHALLHPSDVADVDGRVRGPTGQVFRPRGGHYYSTLSLWDAVRGTYPLLALVAPERMDGLAQTLIDHQRAMGYLPIWTAWGRETWCMIGNPALVALAEITASGFHGFDRAAALQAMIATETGSRAGVPSFAQTDWSVYDRYGFLPFDKVDGESVSKTMEYAWGDDAVARVARRLGRADLAARYAARSRGWRRLFDPQTQMVRGRDSTGHWRTPFDPLIATSPLNNPGDYTEANAWQYTVAAGLFDPEGFVTLLGGPKAAGDWLDRFFATPAKDADKHLGQEGLIGQYAQGNEPSHHVAYLYAWTDRPWKAQTYIRRAARDFYSDRPDGLPGNDDAGQMGAWYVFASLGFYPVAPASGDYVVGAPQVRWARLRLAHGRTLVVSTDGFGTDHPFVRSVSWNGGRVKQTALPHAALVRGGDLHFSLSEKPTPAP